MQFAEQLDESAATISETLSSPEIAGQLGRSQTLINKSNQDKVTSHVEQLADDLKTSAEKAENYSDLIINLLEASNDSVFEDKISSEHEWDRQHGHIGLMLLGVCGNFLDDLDELTGMNSHDVLCDMVDDLDKQNFLSTVSSLCFGFFVSDQQFVFSYGNTFSRELPKIVDKLKHIAQKDSTEFDELVDLYRRWGPLCETAIPPVISSIYYLKSGEIDLEKADEMSLNDCVEWIETFPPLSSVGSRLNVNLRNAVLHGGKNAGYNPNPLTNEIEIWYKEGQETKTEVYSKDEFKKIVVETLVSVVILFLVPLYLISSHAAIEITEAQSQTNS